ncbi:MAG: glycosyltransferase [Schaedlerella sp.]|nr:glycosyltransferase [Schaedlerella sp.]
MRPKVSVIIPIYNVENFLNRCIDSVLKQSLSDLEIILVDDGSPDNSPKICDEYAAIDARIKVVHKKNGGLASARNAGLDIATGEYVFFLDSDDWLELDGLEHLYTLGDDYGVDFVRYRAIRSGWPGLTEHAPCMLEGPREMPGGYYDKRRIEENIIPRLLITPQMTFGPILGAWGALYRHDFLKKCSLRFYEDIKFSEDVLFSANVVRNANSFYYEDNAGVYHYYYNAKSISKSYRKGRWDSCKKLIIRAYEDFATDSVYNFEKQLNILSWFCIMLALNERKNIPDKKQRKLYCKTIMADDTVKKCEYHAGWFKISIKQQLLMCMVKNNLWWLVAEV